MQPDIPDYDDMTEEERERQAHALLMRLEQDNVNDGAEDFFRMYGIEHHCRCAEDVATSNTSETPECYLRMTEQAMAVLREARATLYVIATDPTSDLHSLRRLAHEVFFKPDVSH